MGRTLLSDAFDVAVAVDLAVEVASVGRTLLSDAFDLDSGVARAADLEVAGVVALP